MASLLTPPAASADLHLAPAVSYGTGGLPQAVAVADFNGDSKPDLAVANNADGTVSVLLGNGDGTFQSKLDQAAGTSPVALAAADLNGDGKQDLAVATATGVSVLIGKGDGTFDDAVSYGAGGASGVAIGDLNGDGKLDLAAASASGNIAVFLGDGTGAFQPETDYAVGRSPSSVAIGDLNGDGIPDAAVTNAGSDTFSVLLGNGDGTFQPETELGTPQHPASVAIGDLNHDGIADVVVGSGTLTSGSVSVFVGKGEAAFADRVDYPAGLGTASVALADVNGDGRPDVASANGVANTVSLLLGNGDGSLKPKVDFAAGTTPSSLAIADLNGDGEPDLAAVNPVALTGGASVLLNDSTPVLVADPSKLSFPSQAAGTAGSPEEVTIRNVGAAPLRITSASLAGPDADQYALSNDGCSGKTVAVGSSCPVDVAFQPTAAKTTSASLQVVSNASSSPDSVALDGTSTGPNRALGVTVGGRGSGQVTSSPAGIACGSTCTHDFADGSTVTLTGVPAAHSTAPSWSGCDSIDSFDRCVTTLTGARSVTANFGVIQRRISVTKLGTGSVKSVPAGIDCGRVCSHTFDDGKVVTLTATPGSTTLFAGWFGACSGFATCKLTMTADRGATAVFGTPQLKQPVISKPAIDKRKRSVRLTFKGSFATGFQCALARRVTGHALRFRYFACWPPTTYTNIETAQYVFRVRALFKAVKGPIAERDFRVNLGSAR